MRLRANVTGCLSVLAAFSLAMVLGLSTRSSSAQAPSSNGNQPPDISGLWLLHDPGSGDWSSFFDNVPKADVVPAIQKMNDDDTARLNAGNVVSTGAGPNCALGNLPMVMASSPPLNIVQSQNEVLMGKEASRGRIIYMEGQAFPEGAGLNVPSGNGHSTGHWEGDTLVVDTVGFAPRICDSRWPVMRVPGGGRAKDTTHLSERYKLMNGGKQLSVTFTWIDPTIYLKPHTYSYTYDLVENGLPIEEGNDVTDSELLKREQRANAPANKNPGYTQCSQGFGVSTSCSPYGQTE